MLIADGGGGAPKQIATNIGGESTSAGLSAINNFLGGSLEIILDAAQIALINGHLDDAETSLAEAKGKLAVVPGGAVGGSPWGQQLAHHSQLANEALLDSLKKMEQGVVYYRDAIKLAVDKITGADDGAGAAARRGEGQFAPQTGQGANG